MEVERTSDEGQSCLLIRTDAATYAYQDEAGGFSSILDVDGRDWIGFRPGPPEVPEGAGHVFRGLPNLVYPDNLGHPGYRLCRSKHTVGHPSVAIDTESNDGRWVWTVTVMSDFVDIEVTKSPPDRAYWFLYEGVPAGRYDPATTVWGTDAGPFAGRRSEAKTPTRPSSLGGARWIYFGYRDYPRVFFVARVSRRSSDPAAGGRAAAGDARRSSSGAVSSTDAVADAASVLFFMNASPVGFDADAAERSDPAGRFADDGMVVFGFGRTPDTRPLLQGPNRFALGFVESTDHEEIRRRIEEL